MTELQQKFRPLLFLRVFFKNNLATIGIIFLFLSFLTYQRLPAYLKDREALNRPAPDFTLSSLGGGTVRLADHRGKKILLNFWATWCLPCRLEIPELRKIHSELNGDKFQLLTVSAESETEIKEFMRGNNMEYPVLLDDGSVLRDYNVQAFPTIVLIDEDGRITDISHGLDFLLLWKIRYAVTGSLL